MTLVTEAWTTDRAVDLLRAAELDRVAMGRISALWPELNVPTAYRVQRALVERRGERVVGVKLGLTSEAKQRRMGIGVPITGVLTEGMLLAPGIALDVDALIHPRVEPELVFVMGADLTGPGVTPAAAASAVAAVHAGLEVIDSRFADFDFALPDVIADNASSARFALSTRGVPVAGLDLQLEAVVLRVNGDVVDTATGAAVLGDPMAALALAANDLAARGDRIRAGDLVLTGGMTDAVEVHPGDDVSVEFTSLGFLDLPIGVPR